MKNCTTCKFIGKIDNKTGMCYNLHSMVQTRATPLRDLKTFKCSEYKKAKGKLWA